MKIHLYTIRKQKQITLTQLERLSGISKTHINEIENERSIPTITVLHQLAKALKVPITELFSCDD
jgi:transcriptional regulator with XRE-family HTH domain